MDGYLKLKGAARLDPAGRFEIFLGSGKDSARKPCTSEQLIQYVRELFDFLMNPRKAQLEIGEDTFLKRRTGTGKSFVEAPFLDGFRIRLIRGEGEYATFIFVLPFIGVEEGEEVEFDRSQTEYEEEVT